MNIYVGNLDYKVNDRDLVTVFEDFGTVSSASVITDKHTGRSKGFGFVTMDNDDEANTAIKELNGAVLKRREMTVNGARPKRETFNK